ncbi:hypothetical protein EVAR_50371_1 [Eumeta japonica]|uniref:Uncharacterized protein n=1 Tax=Eumeta variegata TaxID=151549 RepID=A0A4C1XXB9_EUMVA|nr:hypothetical protein EVAR_50371_1 [Eumeta japonica]
MRNTPGSREGDRSSRASLGILKIVCSPLWQSRECSAVAKRSRSTTKDAATQRPRGPGHVAKRDKLRVLRCGRPQTKRCAMGPDAHNARRNPAGRGGGDRGAV